MSESEDGETRSIATRISQLNQIFTGRAVTSLTHAQAGRESLLDALLALYDECNNTHLMRNQYIANFVNKYTKTIREVRGLRISVTDFNIKNTIGRGHFGEVQVVREKHTGDVYALKVLRKADTLAQQNVAFYEEERDIMAKSCSVWITQLQYAFQDARCLYLVMEFHPGGDLLSLLARFDDVFEEKMARFYLAEMVLALHTLHTMGYVHRDVKPENILIDRTGHIKLADFGSACRLAVSTAEKARSREGFREQYLVLLASVANMPVGTPDYICPEVLMKMNSDDASGRFGAECDWWSLGVCAFEMLYGKTPFTDENGSMVVTYANIMNHKKCLKFSSNDGVADTAKLLMSRLLTDAEDRLDYEAICVHPFFSDIDFDNIRQMRPPFIPTVTSKDDTSNFDDFEKVKRGVDVEDFSRRSTGLTGNDLPFIGFTFTKPLAAQERPSLSSEVASPAAKGSLERRLNQKSRELTESRERYKELEHRLSGASSELNRLRNQMSDRDARIEILEAERRTLELDKAHYMTEVKSLTRLLEMEKQDRQQTEDKAMNLLDDIRKQTDVAQQLRDQTNKQELEEHREVISQLEEENRHLSEKIGRMEHKLAEETAAHYDVMAKVDVLKSKVTELKQTLKDQDSSDRELRLQKELDKANEQRYEAVELLSTLRQSKTRLEEELYALRRRSALDDALRCRVSDAEETKQVLEVVTHRLELVERREATLRDQVTEKSHQFTQIAERLAEAEEERQSAELEHATREKLSQQREEQLRRQIRELEESLDVRNTERFSLEEQSVLLTEDCEEKLQKIYEQEETISQLKSNVGRLESQLDNMREDLEVAHKNHKHRRALSEEDKQRKVRTRRSGFSQTDTPPWKTLRHTGQRIGQTQTETPPAGRSTPHQYPEKRPVGVNVSVGTTPTSPPRKRSNQMQTDAMSPNITSRRRSNNTQTDSPSRRSNTMQTEVTVHVSMSTGPDSPIPEEEYEDRGPEDFLDSADSRDQEDVANDGDAEQSGTETTVDSEHSPNHTRDSYHSANETVIHCGQGDSPTKAKKTRVAPEDDEATAQVEKEKSRRGTEEWSDLQQQKAYLEMRVSNLDQEVAQYKDAAHQQRLRALDLKIEMRDKSTNLESSVSELKEKLDKAELATSAAREASANSAQKEATLREKLDKVQRDLDEVRIDGRRKVTDLTIERDDLQAKVKALNTKVTALEPKEEELRETKAKCQQLEPKNQELERRVEELQEDRNRLRLDAERYRDELQQLKHEHDKLRVQHTDLKAVAEELESQLQDFEQLSEQYEKKASKWSHHKSTYEKAVNERETELDETQRNLNKEKASRQHDEVQINQLKAEVARLRETHKKQTDSLTTKLHETKSAMKELAAQLTQLERNNSHLDVDLGTAQRHLKAANEDNVRLKEEISSLITSVGEVKASNLKLSKSLEEAMDRYELLASQNTDLANQAESNMVNANHEKYKLESTLSQQTKLIDYLQAKVENPPKKKKGLFGSKKPETTSVGIQFRELQHSLEHEREKNSMLRQTITRLQTELYQKHVEGKSHDQHQGKRASATEALTLTPASQSNPVTSVYSMPKVTAGGSRPRKERMHHNIPHRFVTGLNSRATKCAVCLGSVHFVKQAAKCQECQVVCHPKCAPNLPASCGLPTEYVSHFSDVMARQSSSRLSAADLRLKLSSWMKIPRPGKQLWEKKWVTLTNNHIHIYNNEDTSADHVEELALCPSNGRVTVHSAVTAAELTNTASTDLPYILRLEFEPETTCWPGRSVYLMALTFEEKQRWVATLEAIVDHSDPKPGAADAKLLGNTIVSLSGDRRMEFNCTLPISEQVVLVGTDDGLFVTDVTGGAPSRPLTKVKGVAAVYQMEVVTSLNVVVIITGRERQVVLVGLTELTGCAAGRPVSAPAVTPYPLPDAVACTTLAWGDTSDDTFLCAALADKILLLVYDPDEGTFVLTKELLTSQACSCIYFGKNHVIVGTDKFHKINLHNFEMTDLLDKRDTTVAFAAFGAAHYDSFPIAVLQVAPFNEPDEYLLCYHEFGLFVDAAGQRSREDDVKWSGLPLAFAYNAPYLYTIHFNAVQVTEIPPSHNHHSEGSRTLLRLPCARYLGRALSKGAVYIGSAHDDVTEILCIKGNIVTSDADKENAGLQARTPHRSSKRPLVETRADAGFVSPDDVTSPPDIRQLDHSPSGSLSRHKVARVTDRKYTSSTTSSSENEAQAAAPPSVRVGVQIRARAEERRRRRSFEDSSDTSF